MRMKSARLCAACFLVVVITVDVYAQQKPCATASKFGPDDQIGNLNYVTPTKTLAASKLITRGKAYRLGIETNKDTPAYGTRPGASIKTYGAKLASKSHSKRPCTNSTGTLSLLPQKRTKMH